MVSDKIGQEFEIDGEIWKVVAFDNSTPHPCGVYKPWNYVLQRKGAMEFKKVTDDELSTLASVND